MDETEPTAAPRAAASYVVETAIIFVAYFVAGKLGQATTHIRSSNLGPVWPAYGIALAAVLLCGYRAWLGIALSAFLVAFQSPVPHLAAAGQAAGATIAALTGGFLLRAMRFDSSLSRLRDALGLIIVGAAGSAIVSASLGVSVLYATGVQAYTGIGGAWLIYWLGDSTGVLLVTPLVLSASTLASTIRPRLGAGELAALLLSLTVACFLIFGDLPLVNLHVLAFGVLPFIIWAAIRFGVAGVALSTLLVAIIATVETALGSGPFSQNTTFTNAVLLDVFFAVLSVTGVTLATVIAEREHGLRERERLVRDQVALEGRLRAQEAVRESEDKLRLILDSTAEGIYGIDLEGRCTFCNTACLRTLGYESADALIGKNMHQLIHHTHPDGSMIATAECRILKALRTGDGVHVEDEVLWTAAGTSFPAEYWSYPQRRGTEIVGGVVAFIDITSRRQAECQAETLRDDLAHLGRVTMVDALTASLAHEISQPLAATMANTEAALRLMELPSPPLDDVHDALSDILTDTQRASQVVRRMRTLLKKSANWYEPVEINSTVGDIVKLVQSNAAGRGIALDVDLAADIQTVLGDRVQVQQVVLNLLMNAFDAVEEQAAPLRRVSVRTAPRGHAAVVEVRDQGSGLSDDQLALVFEPFYTTKREGLGLGLAISRRIVGAHGGTLDAARNPDSGMTFSVSFPFSSPPIPTPSPAQASMQ